MGQRWPTAVQAAGISSSATTWITRSEHWMMLERSMGWALRTLDGTGTLHGVGIIGAAIPGTKPRKAIRREVTATLETQWAKSLYVILMLSSSICHWPTRRCCRTSLLRTKARYSAFLGRYLIQTGLGCCRVYATGYILIRVLSFPTHDIYGPNQHELHISTLISGTTLWSHTSSYL